MRNLLRVIRAWWPLVWKSSLQKCEVELSKAEFRATEEISKNAATQWVNYRLREEFCARVAMRATEWAEFAKTHMIAVAEDWHEVTYFKPPQLEITQWPNIIPAKPVEPSEVCKSTLFRLSAELSFERGADARYVADFMAKAVRKCVLEKKAEIDAQIPPRHS